MHEQKQPPQPPPEKNIANSDFQVTKSKQEQLNVQPKALVHNHKAKAGKNKMTYSCHWNSALRGCLIRAHSLTGLLLSPPGTLSFPPPSLTSLTNSKLLTVGWMAGFLYRTSRCCQEEGRKRRRREKEYPQFDKPIFFFFKFWRLKQQLWSLLNCLVLWLTVVENL